MTAVTLNLNSIIKLTDPQFYQLCRDNPDVKFERNANGEIIIMSPTGEKLENVILKLRCNLESGTVKIISAKPSTPRLASNFPMEQTVLPMFHG